MQTTIKFRTNADFILREIMGEFLLVPSGDMDFNGLGSLNESGVFLWQQLSVPKTYGALVDCFMKKYEVEKEVAEQDILEFLKAGMEKNAIIREEY